LTVAEELREQGRGMAGALLVLGVSFAYTIEAWWLALRASSGHLAAFAIVGLIGVLVATWGVGFRDNERADAIATGRAGFLVEFAEVVFQSLVAGYGMLFLFGILDLDSSLSIVVRSGLVLLVPLAFGAALANELLSGEQEEMPERGFPWNLAVFAVGAVFVAAPIAPTDEVVVLAVQSGWPRLGTVLVVTLVLSYTILYELEFRGQSRRLQDHSRRWTVGQTCVVYAVAALVALGLLTATNEVAGPLSLWVQEVIVLSFPASIGASGARVVIA
jgi:putative integral membrane protein (TIGR02587 family)